MAGRGGVQLNVRVSPALRRVLKASAVRRGLSVQAVVVEALGDYVLHDVIRRRVPEGGSPGDEKVSSG